jgi:hypothetical protein
MGGAAEYCFVPTSSGTDPPCVGSAIEVCVADFPSAAFEIKAFVTSQMTTATARTTIPIVMMRV